ncbi:hypothetical protein SO802_005364 [Lithocarpus litseifolius]|uniref:Retrovirus-related Pol polyprotein from transposon TNT 1-94 n=1 Tax=Lithocarpus litseifolius TaxID=425828 RepID=A0AAW2DIM6_9ROSI
MASTISSSTSSSIPVVANIMLLANASLLLLSNMSSMMTVKLDYSNYIVLKHQIKVILETYSMIDILDDSIIAPDCYMKKRTDTIDGYFQKIKQIRDKLAVVSVVLDDEELLHIALDGLPSEFDSFSSTIRTHNDVLSVEELNTLLNAEERVINKRSNGVNPPSMAMAMNFQS